MKLLSNICLATSSARMLRPKFGSVLFITMVLSPPVLAKVFKTSYLSIDLPADWTCAQEDTVWICTSSNPKIASDALITLAAKLVGPEDKLDIYLAHFKQPKRLFAANGIPTPSQVVSAQKLQIAGQSWIQAQHLNSEIRDFRTVYLASIKGDLAVQIGLSAQKDRYEKYKLAFDKAISSLRLIADGRLKPSENSPNSITPPTTTSKLSTTSPSTATAKPLATTQPGATPTDPATPASESSAVSTHGPKTKRPINWIGAGLIFIALGLLFASAITFLRPKNKSARKKH